MRKKGGWKNNKKAVSPVIVTVLLILIAIVLAAIIFVWAKEFLKESLSKNEQPAERICEEVDLQVSFSDSGNLLVINRGEIPVFKIGAKINFDDGSTKIVYNETELPVGASRIIVYSQITQANAEYIIPVLLGKTKSGAEQEFACVDKKIAFE